jgi:hypothetical protein
MKLNNYGYREEKAKVRTMSLAELKIGVVQELLRKNYRYVNIRLVNITFGDVEEYRSTEDFLMGELNEGYEVDFVSAKEIQAYNEKEKCSEIRIVILFKETEENNFSESV